LGGGVVVPKKYADLGFEVAGLGGKSKILRFCQKPIFVFSSSTSISAEFLARICEMYLKIYERGKAPEVLPRRAL
jgi:hypothetical protein